MSCSAVQSDDLTWRYFCCPGHIPRKKTLKPLNQNRSFRSVHCEPSRVKFSRKVNKVEPLICDVTGIVEQRSYISLLSSSSDDDDIDDDMKILIEKYVAQTVYNAAVKFNEEEEEKRRRELLDLIEQENGGMHLITRNNATSIRQNGKKLRDHFRQFSMIREVTEYSDDFKPEVSHITNPLVSGVVQKHISNDGHTNVKENVNVSDLSDSDSENITPIESDISKPGMSTVNKSDTSVEEDNEWSKCGIQNSKVKKSHRLKHKVQKVQKISTSHSLTQNDKFLTVQQTGKQMKTRKIMRKKARKGTMKDKVI